MTDISCPVADVDAVLSCYPETVRMRVVSFILARDVSPRCTPKSVLTQLGEECPGDDMDHAANIVASATTILEAADACDAADDAEPDRRGSGDHGAAWKDPRPCTPRGDRKAVFGGNREADRQAET